MPKTRIMTVSTALTASRIIAVPFIVGAMGAHHWGIAWVVFMLAAATDLIDGALARYLGDETIFGAYLDPVADKLLIIACYGALAVIDSPLFKIPLWFFYIIFIKELVLVLGALYVCFVRQSVAVRPTLLGKLTMLFQICFIAWLFACAYFHWVPVKTFYVLLSGIVVLAIGSLVQYALIGIRGIFSWIVKM